MDNRLRINTLMFKIGSVVTENFALQLSIEYIDEDRLLCTV